jgi:subtilisin-like proprotein convertase family protein
MAQMIATISGTVGPFSVTSQNTNGISWAQGSNQTITWVTNGAETLTGSTLVDILLSTDGGATFATTLAAGTANDGTEIITVPNVASSNCRIMIKPTGNIYYAVNANVFTIGYVCNIVTASPNLAIPDGLAANTPGALASSIINVPTTGTVNNMKVTFNTNHTWIGDLVVKLSHPDGTQITLWNRTCNNPQASGINITFQDGAGTIVCGSPTSGTYSPIGLLSAFNGKPTNGNWTLTAQDFYNVDSGSIVSWGVDFGCTLSNSENQISDLTVYPNPTNGSFNIKFNSSSNNDIAISVHDMRGRQVFNNSYQNSGLFDQNIQLDNVQAGVYLVTVQEGDKKVVKKIIVQ